MHRFSKALVYVLIWGLLSPSLQPILAGPPDAEEIKKFQLALQESLKNPEKGVDPSDSFASDLVSKMWSEPKYRYLTGSILVGETLIAAMLVKRMRMNRATWNRQIETATAVAENLKSVTQDLASAEKAVLDHLSRMSQWDRASLLHTIESTKTPLIPAVEKALKEGAAGEGAMNLEIAMARLNNAYEAWQKQAAVEARVLNATGANVKAPVAAVEAPVALSELSKAMELQMRAVTKLQYTESSFNAFREAGVQQVIDKAKLGLGKNLSWRGKFWRKTRTGLLLLAIPVIAVGVSVYFDREVERNRRIEDLNQAALADREKSAKTLIPFFHRPLLYAFVKGWALAQEKDGSLLKRFKCPLEVKAIEEQNESLPIIQAIALQVVLDMEKADEDLIEEDGKKTPMITEKFFKRLVSEVLVSQKSPLLSLKEKERETIIADIAYEAYRAFDKLESK